MSLCIKIATNPCLAERTKHFDIKYHWLREKVKNEDIELAISLKDRLPARARERMPPFIAAAAPKVGMACCSKGRSLRCYRWPAARRWLDRCGAGVCAVS